MKRIAFLDLDLTLFDYTLVRQEATRTALAAMNFDCSIEEALELINSVLIPHGDTLADVGLPNFRREWKAPELFGLLFLMCEGQGLAANSRYLADLLSIFSKDSIIDSGGKFHLRKENYELFSRTIKNSQLEHIFSKVNDLPSRELLGTDLKGAITAFDDYLAHNAKPFKGVDELLTSLKSHGFEVYIVSEGQEIIQQEKTSVLGLNMHTNGTYVSGSCCNSELLLSWVWDSAIEARLLGNIQRLNALEAVYDEAVLYSTKTPSLFRKILHTVLLPDTSRRRFYQEFGWLSATRCNNEEPVHVLLFGDRYDKDLQPGIDAFRNTISLRLLAGKYESTFQSQALERAKLPVPTATVRSVLEAAAVINDLPPVERLPPSQIIAPRAGDRRRLKIRQALEIISGERIPGLLVGLLEGLEKALVGSET